MRLSDFVVHELAQQTCFTNAAVSAEEHLEEVIIVFGHSLGVLRAYVSSAIGIVVQADQ